MNWVLIYLGIFIFCFKWIAQEPCLKAYTQVTKHFVFRYSVKEFVICRKRKSLLILIFSLFYFNVKRISMIMKFAKTKSLLIVTHYTHFGCTNVSICMWLSLHRTISTRDSSFCPSFCRLGWLWGYSVNLSARSFSQNS